MHEVHRHARVLVLQIQGLHIEGPVHRGAVAHPQRGGIEVHHQPLGRVEGDRVRPLDAAQPGAELRADEGAAGVRRVHVEPQVVLRAHQADLVEDFNVILI